MRKSCPGWSHFVYFALFNTHTLSHFQKVQNPLKPYVQALMQGMPQKCKMPLYEYGSKGVLGFYQAQLAPVVTYRDLQTDVFQSFKEIGNTVIFCLQLEKALVGHLILYTTLCVVF